MLNIYVYRDIVITHVVMDYHQRKHRDVYSIVMYTCNISTSKLIFVEYAQLRCVAVLIETETLSDYCSIVAFHQRQMNQS